MQTWQIWTYSTNSTAKIPPQLNWLPLRYLNLAASLTIYEAEIQLANFQ